MVRVGSMALTVYLSGEIHTTWRDDIRKGAAANDLDIRFTSPVTDHAASDAAHKSSKVNAIRTKTLIQEADLVVVRFGDKYKQWNAAFDAGYCAAMSKPYITLHADDIVHPLKEVDAMALAWARTTDQVVDILKYVERP
jgi:hypothetical protein